MYSRVNKFHRSFFFKGELKLSYGKILNFCVILMTTAAVDLWEAIFFKLSLLTLMSIKMKKFYFPRTVISALWQSGNFLCVRHSLD